jgi:phage/plasmid primase-like uncharacterized protein
MSRAANLWPAKAHAVRLEDELARRGFPFWTKPKADNKGQPCPACGGIDRFRISTTKQLFLCNQCGKSGDVIDLVKFLDGVGFLDAVKTLAGPEPTRNEHKPDPEAQRRSEERQKADEDKERTEENTRRRASLKIWADAAPVDDTGLVDRYLREERKISLSPDDWAYLSPRVIRFHPRCPFGQNKAGKQLYDPAMVCLFRNVVDDAPQAIFRIALTPDGKKIDRLAYGRRGATSFAGLAAIKLFDDAEVEQGLVIVEGVETALAAAYGGGYRPVWAMW